MVSMDESALILREVNATAPDSRGIHRYQHTKVRRGEGFVVFTQDLGLASGHKAEEFQIPGGVIDRNGKFIAAHTVGELMDIADDIRAGFYGESSIEPSDLIGDYHKQMDDKRKARKGLSTFGPHGALVRTSA